MGDRAKSPHQSVPSSTLCWVPMIAEKACCSAMLTCSMIRWAFEPLSRFQLAGEFLPRHGFDWSRNDEIDKTIFAVDARLIEVAGEVRGRRSS
jgi:hypothetical protein